jgi:hypothetical protein
MAKPTRKEILLQDEMEGKRQKTAPLEPNQVGLNMLPDQVSLDSNNWWVTNFSLKLPSWILTDSEADCPV